LTFEVLQPLKLKTKTWGSVAFEPGQRVTWPEKAVRLLLQKAPKKIRVVEDFPVRCGQRVRYRIPINIRNATDYSWKECEGVVEMIDHQSHLALIIPEAGDVPWLWVNMDYVQPLSTPKEAS
jgi:hypothetical protein